jgi:hypothetical protein
MVGQRTLTPPIKVQILVSQPQATASGWRQYKNASGNPASLPWDSLERIAKHIHDEQKSILVSQPQATASGWRIKVFLSIQNY